jgi:dipeptidyl aminopeptidase/acylaminoacyl peptidase
MENLTACVQLSIAVGLACLAGKAGLAPAGDRGGPASRSASKPAGAMEDAEFKAAFDGTVQKYIIRLPEGFDSSRACDLMIALHGHGADRRQYATDGRGECKGARDVAGKHGMIFVSPDYRATMSWMGPAAEADVVQLIGLLRKQYSVGKVFLVGGSMGGTAALTFTALHPELVDGVSSQNGVANLLEYAVDFVGIQAAIKDAFGGRKDETPQQYKRRCPDEYRKRSAELFAERFTMPVSFTVGGKDDIVPPQSVRRLAAAVRKHNADVLLIDRPQGGHETNYEDTVAALEFIIKAAAKRRPAP